MMFVENNQEFNNDWSVIFVRLFYWILRRVIQVHHINVIGSIPSALLRNYQELPQNFDVLLRLFQVNIYISFILQKPFNDCRENVGVKSVKSVYRH